MKICLCPFGRLVGAIVMLALAGSALGADRVDSRPGRRRVGTGTPRLSGTAKDTRPLTRATQDSRNREGRVDDCRISDAREHGGSAQQQGQHEVLEADLPPPRLETDKRVSQVRRRLASERDTLRRGKKKDFHSLDF